MATKNTTSQRKSMGLGAALLAALLILVLTLAPVPVDTQAAANVQPALLAMAAEQPETQVRVIVQKINADADVSTLVAELGGEVVQDLSIINAQTVILSAGQIPKLGGSETVRWVSLDSAMEQSGAPSGCDDCIDTSELISAYVQTIGASQLWNEPPYLQGQGVTVAIVDSGFAPHDDLNETTKKNSGSRLLDKTKFNSFSNSISDGYGHSTHIAGIIAGNGAKSHGAYIGVAPKVNFVIV